MNGYHLRDVSPSWSQVRVFPSVGSVLFGVGAKCFLGPVQGVDVVVHLLALLYEDGVISVWSTSLWQCGVCVGSSHVERQWGEEAQSCRL